MKKLPKHCQGHSLGLFDIIKSKFDGFFKIPVDECLEYHKAIRAAPHSQVTPVQVGRFLVHSKENIEFSIFSKRHYQ